MFEQNQFMNSQQRKDFQLKPLDPVEEESWLKKVGGSMLGGLGYLGASLEKGLGGRAIRGAIGGKGRELLSIIPFSDAMGITDYADRVSGKDINRQLGLSDGTDTWGNFFGGLATEVLTDPSMYFVGPGKALTQAGHGAAKANVLPTTLRGRLGGNLKGIMAETPLAERVGLSKDLANAYGGAAAGGASTAASLAEQSLSGLFGVRPLPFMQPIPVFTGKAGLGALDFAGSLGKGLHGLHTAMESTPLLGTAYHLTGLPFMGGLAAKGADAAYRHGKALFQQPVLEATSHPGQSIAVEASQDALKRMAAHREKAFGWAQQLQQHGVQDGDLVRQWLDDVGTEVPEALRPLVAEMRAARAAATEDLRRYGLNVNPMPTEATHQVPGGAQRLDIWPRHLTIPHQPGLPRSALNTTDPLLINREPALMGYPGATTGFNKAAVDPFVRNLENTAEDAASHLIEIGLLPKDMPIREAVNKVYAIRGLYAHPPAAARGGVPFGNHPVSDWLHAVEHKERIKTSAEAAYNIGASQAIPVQGGVIPQNAVRLQDALRQAGFSDDLAAQEMAKRLGHRFENTFDPGEVANFVLDRAHAEDMIKVFNQLRPSPPGVIGRGVDYFTNLFKNWVTNPFPSFWARNFASAGFNNAQLGGLEAVMNIPAAYRNLGGHAMPQAAAVPGLEGLSPAAATAVLNKEMAVQNIMGRLQGQGNEVLGALRQTQTPISTTDEVLSLIPGYKPQTIGNALATYGGRGELAGQPLIDKLNPINIAGLSEKGTLSAPIKGGQMMGDIVEGTNRGALYTALRRQGYNPAAARQKVIDAHFDYSGAGLTRFESDYMRRLVPFYSFARFNTPFVASTLANNPGGLAGTYAKTALNLRQEEDFLPPHLGSGLAVPMGTSPTTGHERYLTRMDTPVEAMADYFKPGGIGASLMGLMAQSNPLIRAPLEMATGKTFSSGRELDDMYSPTGSVPLDQLLQSSPASRVITTARTLADPRKWERPVALPINLLTGARVTDVDMPKLKDIAAKKYVDSILAGNPGVNRFDMLSISQDALGNMTNEDLELARLRKTLEIRQQQRAAEQARLRPIRIQ